MTVWFDEYDEYGDDAFALGRLTIRRSSWPVLWCYWGGGKEHQAPDRELGDLVADGNPEIVEVAKLRLAARERLVRYMVAAGLRQILVVGCDLPSHPVHDEVHEVAHRVDPAVRVRVVYASDHPVVMAHARGLMAGGGAGFVDAPLTSPGRILSGAANALDLDLDEPVGVLLLNQLDTLRGRDARDITRFFAAALAPGSHIAVTHLTAKGGPLGDVGLSLPLRMRELFTAWQTPPPVFRDPTEIAHLLDDWDLVEPGFTSVPQRLSPTAPGGIGLVVAVGRKPDTS